MSLLDKKKLDYIVLNPAATEENYLHYPHEKMSCPGFADMKELLPVVMSLDELSDDEYQMLVEKAQTEQSLVCAFVCSPLSTKDLATELSLNLKQKNQQKWHYFWYIAPKIQTYLSLMLDNKQQSSLFNAVSEWHYFDLEWSQSWKSWTNKTMPASCSVLDLSPAQWELVERIPNAIRSKFFFDCARDNVIENKAYTQIRYLDKINNPKDYLKIVTQIYRKYPIESTSGFGQFLEDYLTDEELAKKAYQTMLQNSSDDYLVYSRISHQAQTNPIN